MIYTRCIEYIELDLGISRHELLFQGNQQRENIYQYYIREAHKTFANTIVVIDETITDIEPKE